MSELEMPTVITAIANSDAEGFVAGTLFAQGWNVVFRAIDWVSLDTYVQSNPELAKTALLIFGSDLPGADKKSMDSLNGAVRQIPGHLESTRSRGSCLGQSSQTGHSGAGSHDG